MLKASLMQKPFHYRSNASPQNQCIFSFSKIFQFNRFWNLIGRIFPEEPRLQRSAAFSAKTVKNRPKWANSCFARRVIFGIDCEVGRKRPKLTDSPHTKTHCLKPYCSRSQTRARKCGGSVCCGMSLPPSDAFHPGGPLSASDGLRGQAASQLWTSSGDGPVPVLPTYGCWPAGVSDRSSHVRGNE